MSKKIELIIPTGIKRGKKRILINIELSEEKKKALKEKCKELGISYSFLLNSFIDQFLEAKWKK